MRNDVIKGETVATFAEDLQAMAGRAYELALEFCGPCANYHIYWTARRAAGIVGGVDADRHLLVKQLANLAKRFTPPGDRGIDLLIPGVADSGILAAAVAAIFEVGGRSLLQRTEFTVIDQCATPLKLCEEYSRKHDLKVSTERCKLENYRPDRSFDLVFAHSVLAFFQPEDRARMLSAMANWLKKDGHFVYSANLGVSENTGKAARFENIVLPRIGDAVADGRIKLCEEETAFLERCRQRHQGISYESTGFRTLDELHALAESANVEIESVKLADDDDIANGIPRRSRVIAVFKRSIN